MQYAQLRAFHAVAEHGGFSRAAQALSLTQPAISDHVRRLETDYGVKLFERAPRGVELTDLGRRLYAVTRQMVGCERDARRLLEAAGALESGELALVADAPDLAVKLIGAFRRRYPGVVVKLAIANATECMRRVLSSEVDAAITAAPQVHSRLQSRVLREDPLVAVVPAESPAAKKRRITYEELVREPMIFREAHSVTQQLLEAELVRKGLQAEPVLYVDGREALQTAIAQGVGAGVIAGAEFGESRRIRAIALVDCQVRMVETLVRLAEPSSSNLLDALFATPLD
ncbi:HTH-type transcriptional activator CmpR [Paraburkholderia caffeinitolerans]|uniref:HTH-type transcriptional activator CmpR n=1 Tax=Paraburkholderia caffeinitolerans TaxID=1723730 RepID=A0A6J5GB72_9BURK|nr:MULTISPECIES: LysR substrate-binding domain-containing protein [Paraburkholderia]CAB3795602.1 HTH-type transcriptional activator CmpR [Paraburkholderia caffeinitolerans]